MIIIGSIINVGLNACCYDSICYRCFHCFGVGVFTTVSIGYIIIHTIQRYGFYSALVVIGVLHGIVSAPGLGYNVKGPGLRSAVFLAGFGAVGDSCYSAVLISAVGELTTVGKTY